MWVIGKVRSNYWEQKWLFLALIAIIHNPYLGRRTDFSADAYSSFASFFFFVGRNTSLPFDRALARLACLYLLRRLRLLAFGGRGLLTVFNLFATFLLGIGGLAFAGALALLYRRAAFPRLGHFARLRAFAQLIQFARIYSDVEVRNQNEHQRGSNHAKLCVVVCEEALKGFVAFSRCRWLDSSEKLSDTLKEEGSLTEHVERECKYQSRNHEVKPSDEALACPTT